MRPRKAPNEVLAREAPRMRGPHRKLHESGLPFGQRHFARSVTIAGQANSQWARNRKIACASRRPERRRQN